MSERPNGRSGVSFDEGPAALGRAFGTALILFHSQVAELLGLSLSDYRCLEMVQRADEPVTAGALAEASGLTTGAVTGVIDRLERAGYVSRVRDEYDRRRVLVKALTDNTSRSRWIFDSLFEASEQVRAQFTDEEYAVVGRYLRMMEETFRSETVKLSERAGASIRRPKPARGRRPS